MKFGVLRKNGQYPQYLIPHSDNSYIGGIRIGGVPIYFPVANRMAPGNFDPSVYDEMKLRKNEGERLQYFLIAPNLRKYSQKF
jgi:hypothetical protein